MGRLIGYARVSTVSQSLEVQKKALIEYGVHPDLIFAEKMSGTKYEEREQLQIALKVLTEGDTLVVTKMDRLGRSTDDTIILISGLSKRGINFVAIDQTMGIDTRGPAGKMLITMMAIFAETELVLRKERCRAGIARARENKEEWAKKYKGGVKTLNRELIEKLLKDGNMSMTNIAKEAGCSRLSVYRVRDEIAESGEGKALETCETGSTEDGKKAGKKKKQ